MPDSSTTTQTTWPAAAAHLARRCTRRERLNVLLPWLACGILAGALPAVLCRALKQMGLPRLYMALALARVQDHTLTLAGAGMPPALVHRAADHRQRDQHEQGEHADEERPRRQGVREVPARAGDVKYLTALESAAQRCGRMEELLAAY